MTQWLNDSSIASIGTQPRRQETKDHGVTFEQAAPVFLDPRLLSQLDEEHGEGEERWLSLGLDRAARLLVVCHTYREVTPRHATIRIISARRATRPETKAYEEWKR